MQLIATYSFRYGLGNNEEIIRQGDWFTPKPTVHQNNLEAYQQALSQGHGRAAKNGETAPE